MSPVIRVLLIEDDPQDVRLVTRRLERELGSLDRLHLERVETLEAGIERLRKGGVDVVLLDLHLPDSQGTRTVRRLRAANARVPVVVFTSAGDDEMPVRALQEGAQDYLSKSDFDTGPVIHRSLRYAIERVRIHEESQRLQNELEEARRMASLGVLGAGAAFGFSQLIGEVLEHADAALAQLPDEPRLAGARLHLAELHRTALRGADLSDRLRQYARTDARPLERLGLAALVRAALPQLEAIAGRSVKVDLALADDTPPVLANPLELQQLLIHLFVNAAEATHADGGWIRVETGGVEADTALLSRCHGAPELAPGRYAALTVTDSGRGLDGAALARIFDPFFTTKFAGRGLGLAATLGIARRHRGAIEAQSDERGGARFRVLLPAAEAAAATS